jgi:hypothetical protein
MNYKAKQLATEDTEITEKNKTTPFLCDLCVLCGKNGFST